LKGNRQGSRAQSVRAKTRLFYFTAACWPASPSSQIAEFSVSSTWRRKWSAIKKFQQRLPARSKTFSEFGFDRNRTFIFPVRTGLPTHPLPDKNPRQPVSTKPQPANAQPGVSVCKKKNGKAWESDAIHSAPHQKRSFPPAPRNCSAVNRMSNSPVGARSSHSFLSLVCPLCSLPSASLC